MSRLENFKANAKTFFDPSGSKLKKGAYIALGATTAVSFLGWNVCAKVLEVGVENAVDYFRHNAPGVLWGLTNLATQESANVLATDTALAAAVPSVAVLVAGGINSLRNRGFARLTPLILNADADEADPLLRGNPMHVSKPASVSAMPQFSELLNGFMQEREFALHAVYENRIYSTAAGATSDDYYVVDEAAGTLTNQEGKIFKINKDFDLEEQAPAPSYH